MTALTLTPDETPVSAQLRHVAVRSRKFPVVLTVVTAVLGLIIGLFPRAGDTRFRFTPQSPDRDFQHLELTVPGMTVAWAGFVVLAVAALLSWGLYVGGRRTGWFVGVIAGLAFLAGFLAWAGAGSTNFVSVVRLLSSTLLLAVPIIFGALGGAIGERAGVVNIAIEAQLLASAFVAAVVGTLTGSPWAGLGAALIAGGLVALVLGAFTITYRVNQVIVGVVLNMLVLGLTSFLYSQVLVPNTAALNKTTLFGTLAIPGLSKIPVIGPALFDQSLIVYVMYVTVPIVWFAMFHTRWGQRLRAVGEHPMAADTVGIKVEQVRYRALLIAGGVVGMGGAYFTLVSVSSFGKYMTAGAGFIALAAVIFGKWDPLKAAAAGLLFGFASALEGVMSTVGSPVPSQFMKMLPYVVTLLAVAGLVGRSRAPAADGVPYVKE